jgi:uncharacterized protein YbjT (DUF2867 family)
MRVLLSGASGFIGRALVQAFARRGHDLVLLARDTGAAARRWPGQRVLAADFSRDLAVADWRDRLVGIDVVVNAVGILREHGGQTFEAVHVRAPAALFAACAEGRVRRVIQISALGADEHAASAYHRSKREADRRLAALPLRSTVVRPSLVFAPEGESARWFSLLASLPLIPVPGRGGQCLQPIHRDDLVEAIVAVAEAERPPPVLDAVGPAPVTLRVYLATLRDALGLGRAHFLPVPRPLARAGAAVGRHLPGVLLDRDTLAMLERGNCADAGGIGAVLGRPPRAPAEFLGGSEATTLRRGSQLGWLLPLLRLSVALMWLVTAALSFGLYPVAGSLDLLAGVGLHGMWALIALYGAASFDLALGIATLVLPRRRWLYTLQIALVLGYTVIISLWLPQFWLHPFGPVLKNLPILAALWLLRELDGGEIRR